MSQVRLCEGDLGDWPETPPDTVLCRRVMRPVRVTEHERCAYCFGRRADVESGRHGAFCDYHAGKDPIHFGFPPGEVRFEHG